MNQMIIHLHQWLKNQPLVVNILFIVSVVKTFFWYLKILTVILTNVVDFIINHQNELNAFFNFLENLAKTLSYFNVFLSYDASKILK